MNVPFLLPRERPVNRTVARATGWWPAGDVSNSYLSLLEAPNADIQIHLAGNSHYFTRLLQDIDHERRHQVDEDEQAVGAGR